MIEVFSLMDGQPPGDPTLNRVALVVGEVVPGFRANEHENLLELALQILLNVRGFAFGQEWVSQVLSQLLTHLLNGQDEIDQTGVDGAAGHGVVLGLGLLLGLGQGTTGLYAIGQLAIGFYFGLGQFATGWIAIGMFAYGKYVLAMEGYGDYIWSMKRKDPVAVEFFKALLFRFGIG